MIDDFIGEGVGRFRRGSTYVPAPTARNKRILVVVSVQMVWRCALRAPAALFSVAIHL